MIYFISFIVVLGIPVFLHELGHFLAAKSVGIKVEKFYVGFDFFNLGIKKKYKDTEYGIGLFPLGGYVKVAGILDENMDLNTKGQDFEFRSKNVFQKVWFLSAGVIMNFILAIFVFTCFTLFQGHPEVIDRPIIDEVFEEFPANFIGLKKDDEILSIDNTSIKTFSELQEIVNSNLDNSINIEWIRKNGDEYQTFNSAITPVKQEKFEKGKIVEIGIIGIRPYYDIIDANLFESIFHGVAQTVWWTKHISYSILALISGEISMNELSGPLGIAQIAGETASSGGLYSLIGLMAIISINLGIINIIPLPVVDGGHVLIAIIEGIIRREIPIKIKYFIQVFGTLFLLFLFIFVFANDIYKLFK